MAGGALSAAGLAVGNGAADRSGTATASFTGSGTIEASGGTLDLVGSLSGPALTIDTVANSTLKIDGSAAAGAITLNNANQKLEIGAAGSLTIAAAQSLSAGTIQLDGGTLSDAAGLTLTGGTLIGKGTVGPGTAISGTASATIKASGGTLDLAGTVNSGPTLAIDTTAGSTLKIDGTATAASAIAINNLNQTLAIGAAGNLTISAAESITNGTITLSGGSLTASSLTIGNGALLTGFGTVTGSVGGGGTIEASGGTLDLVDRSAVRPWRSTPSPTRP